MTCSLLAHHNPVKMYVSVERVNLMHVCVGVCARTYVHFTMKVRLCDRIKVVIDDRTFKMDEYLDIFGIKLQT